jgi:hypothetical protein
MLTRILLLTLLLFGLQGAVQAQKTQILLFWSESCPICIFYGPEIRSLQNKFGDQTDWTFVFPNAASSDSSAAAYLSKNQLSGKIVVENATQWVSNYAIEVTPEVVLLSPQGTILYAGRIDNSYEKIGRRRYKATATELADRLTLIADKQTFTYIRTRAVGCFLHSNP